MDASGQPQSFLSTDEHYRTVKTLHEKNLIVPLSGDFGGPKAIRAIGAYLKKQGGTVSAFYVSNVEQYLFQDGKATRLLRERRDAAADRGERVHPAVLDAPRRRRDAVALRHRPVRCGGERRENLLQQRRPGLREIANRRKTGLKSQEPAPGTGNLEPGTGRSLVPEPV